ncbi:MAG: DMT family transporter [Bacteroidales bacterium]|nr:DMT family transporter [Bacteroidales bacterium]
MRPEWKGYSAVLVSTLAMSNVYIFSKAALNEMSLAAFGFYWFGFALIWNLIYMAFAKKLKALTLLNFRQLKILVLLGIIEVVATTGFFAAIQTMEQPATVSFLANIGPIYVTILAFWFLKETLRRQEILGAIITLTGAFIISYQTNFSINSDFGKGLILIMIYTLIFAIGSIISKKHITHIAPSILTLNRALYLFIFSSIIFMSTEANFDISNAAIINTLLGSLLGPTLAALAGYYAIQFIPASKASILGAFKGFLVLVTSYLYFGLWPQWYQILGGVLTVLGVVTITLSKQKNK